jgi:hypothetical protein
MSGMSAPAYSTVSEPEPSRNPSWFRRLRGGGCRREQPAARIPPGWQYRPGARVGGRLLDAHVIGGLQINQGVNNATADLPVVRPGPVRAILLEYSGRQTKRAASFRQRRRRDGQRFRSGRIILPHRSGFGQRHQPHARGQKICRDDCNNCKRSTET